VFLDHCLFTALYALCAQESVLRRDKKSAASVPISPSRFDQFPSGPRSQLDLERGCSPIDATVRLVEAPNEPQNTVARGRLLLENHASLFVPCVGDISRRAIRSLDPTSAALIGKRDYVIPLDRHSIRREVNIVLLAPGVKG
jgi:hypothetical protein